MKIKFFFAAILSISAIFFFSCKTLGHEVTEKQPLAPKEGIILVRIWNVNGGTSDATSYFLNTDGKVDESRGKSGTYKLNSDLIFCRNDISIYTAENTEDNYYLMRAAKKGKWSVNGIGRDTTFLRPYRFDVEDGCINYAGDFEIYYFEDFHGVLLPFPADYFKLTVTDNFEAACEYIKSLDGFGDYEIKNKSSFREIYPDGMRHILEK